MGNLRGTASMGLDTEPLIGYQGQPVMPESKAELVRLRDEAKEAGNANRALQFDAVLAYVRGKHPDGPDDGRLFWHDNVPHEPTDTNMSLIKVLHGNGWVDYVRLGDEIWGKSDTSAETIQSCVTRTNRWFRGLGLPYFVGTGDERLILKQEP